MGHAFSSSLRPSASWARGGLWTLAPLTGVQPSCDGEDERENGDDRDVRAEEFREDGGGEVVPCGRDGPILLAAVASAADG